MRDKRLYKKQLEELFIFKNVYFSLKENASKLLEFEDTHELLPDVRISLDTILTQLDIIEHELFTDMYKLKEKIDSDYKTAGD